MAKALQHSQATLIARISTSSAADDKPVPVTARSGRANAIISPSRWYKKAVRPARDKCAKTGPQPNCPFTEIEHPHVMPLNAGHSRSFRKSPVARECVVADAVGFEPVSTPKFPANREINREFFNFGPARGSDTVSA